MKKIIAYAAGSCLGNPGVGGYASFMTADGKTRKACGTCKKQTTNNGVALYACLSILLWLNKYQKEPCEVVINTTSDYVVKVSKKTYRELFDKERKNSDLWQAIVRERNKGNHKIIFQKADKTTNADLKDQAYKLAHEMAVKARHEVYCK